MNKTEQRLRRAKRTRATIVKCGDVRLSVYRTPRHIYAQVFKPTGGEVLTSASTLDKEIKAKVKGAVGNVKAASLVGALVAKRALALGIKKIAFDRAGFKYHGRVKALADAAREAGLEF